MIIQLTFNHKPYQADLLQPLDLSLPLKEGSENPECYWAEPAQFDTIQTDNFTGSVKAGGSVNYQKLTLTPHGNGTHTECYGHISDDGATLNQCLKTFHFIAEVITVSPQAFQDDLVVTADEVAHKIQYTSTEALVIRTLPNSESKKTFNYSGTNPPYLHPDVAHLLVSRGIQHVLIDLPSVDREQDGGKLLSHKAFWQFPTAIRKQSTITELIFVDPRIPDGLYLLNLQITSLEMDASPSKPVLYKLKEVS